MCEVEFLERILVFTGLVRGIFNVRNKGSCYLISSQKQGVRSDFAMIVIRCSNFKR